jgi:hypothetical protein
MNSPSSLLGLKVAQGKTTIAVEAIRRLALPRTLIVAPRNTAVSAWERTIRRQYQDYTNPDLFRRIDSSKSGKLAMDAFWDGEAGFYFVTWEFMRTRATGFWNKLKVDVIILDEVHRMQNRNSKTWAQIRNLKATKKIAMSGTFVGNKLSGAWTTLRWLWPEELNDDGTFKNGLYATPRGFWNWCADWLVVEEDVYGYTQIEGELYEEGTMLSYYPAYMSVGDDLGIDEPEVIDIDCSMNMQQKALYKQVIEENIAWLDTPDPLTGKLPVVTELPVTQRLRLRQITLGVPSFNEEGKVSYDVDTYSSKLDESLEVLSDLPPMEPVLVFTHSREFALVSAERYNRAGYRAFAWVGNTSDNVRSDALAKWGTEVQIIVAVVEAIAEGTDGLQDYCSTEFWFSESENMYMNTQAMGRLPRPGNPHRVTRYRFIVPGTYDQKIIDKHLARRLGLNQSLREGTENV